MKALLLAAGKGTRISRYLGGRPKCTVDIGGIPLIRYTIDMLRKKGIEKIAVCTGYEHACIEELLKDDGVEFYCNPFYDVTNSLASAWFAKDFIAGDEDILIMNADVFCEESVYDERLTLDTSPVMLADSTRKEEADYKFYYENNRLLKYGKELTGDDITGEYVGIAKLRHDFLPQFLARLSRMVDGGQYTVWWENVLYALSEEQAIFVHDIAGKFWAEVDYIEDYERILNFRKQASVR
jgi:choline kinase